MVSRGLSMKRQKLNIMCVAGEASGDLHGAPLVKKLRERHPNAHIYGMGMSGMAENMELLVDATDIAVVGLAEALPRFAAIRRAYNRLKHSIETQKPDLLIVIDTPEIGLRLAAVAKAHHCKVLYYIGPQIWAWRAHRIKKIRACVDAMAVILPFEETLYTNAGIRARYVGNPLVHEAQQQLQSLREQKTDAIQNETTILLMPGSRRNEIKRMLPLFCRAARRLQNELKSPPRFTALVAPGVNRDTLRTQFEAYGLDVELRDDTYAAIKQASLVLVASGTATLQVALCRTPMIVAYKLSPLTYLIVKSLVRIPYVSLVNILGGKEVVPEFIQSQATPKNIAGTAKNLLTNMDRYQTTVRELTSIAELLGDKDGVSGAADIAKDLLDSDPARA